eukprot:scaffold1083_cov165-Ochromonas_danica.AAC.5
MEEPKKKIVHIHDGQNLQVVEFDSQATCDEIIDRIIQGRLYNQNATHGALIEEESGNEQEFFLGDEDNKISQFSTFRFQPCI